MRIFLFGLAWAAFPALGSDLAVSIRLYTQFQTPPARNVMPSVHRELAAIMSPMGMDVEWRSMAENKGNELSVKVAVIRFTGRCDLSNLATDLPGPGALGWTHMVDGAIIPFSDIDCTRIRGFLRGGLAALPKEEREEAYGRAIARVLAHELYHILINTTRHGSDGLAKPHYTEQELLSKDFEFEPKVRQELRRYWSDAVTGGS